MDFCLRFTGAGGQVLYAPEASLVHVKSSSRISPVRVERWKAQSLVRYFRRHFDGLYPPGFIPLVSGMVWAVFGLRAAKYWLGRGLSLIGLSGRRGLRAPARAARIARR